MCLRLVALLLLAAASPLEAAMPLRLPAGLYTYADTTRSLDHDMAIAAWEAHCVRPGRIHRIAGDQKEPH